VAAQVQARITNCFKEKCGLCKEYEETIGHLTSECPILAKNDYIMRHDKSAHSYLNQYERNKAQK
jgi:hypothetical protein